jgi:hypothetical protein
MYDNYFSWLDSLSQLSAKEYLQNEVALEKYKKERRKLNDFAISITAAASAAFFVGVYVLAVPGVVASRGILEYSTPIDFIVKVMEILLEEFKAEGITITPRVKTAEGMIDLLIRTADRRYFALMLRSNGDSKVNWREDRQELFVMNKRTAKWTGIYSLGQKISKIMLHLKAEKNSLMGSSNNERKKGFTKAIVLMGKTRVDPNHNPDFLVVFGQAQVLRIRGESTLYVVDFANLANFLRKHENKPSIRPTMVE